GALVGSGAEGGEDPGEDLLVEGPGRARSGRGSDLFVVEGREHRDRVLGLRILDRDERGVRREQVVYASAREQLLIRAEDARGLAVGGDDVETADLRGVDAGL